MPEPIAAGIVCAASVLILLAWAIPGVRVLRRMGLPGWCVVIGLIPGLNLIGLWALAYTPWPAVDGVTPPAPPP